MINEGLTNDIWTSCKSEDDRQHPEMIMPFDDLRTVNIRYKAGNFDFAATDVIPWKDTHKFENIHIDRCYPDFWFTFIDHLKNSRY